jgi:DNA-directed RNA polymerase specialized sigma24 family protein
MADWSAQPDDLLLRMELRKELATAIRPLSEMYRTVLLLRDVEELSTHETAEILDLSEDGVKIRLHRARLAVRQKLDERLSSERPSLSAQQKGVRWRATSTQRNAKNFSPCSPTI